MSRFCPLAKDPIGSVKVSGLFAFPMYSVTRQNTHVGCPEWIKVRCARNGLGIYIIATSQRWPNFVAFTIQCAAVSEHHFPHTFLLKSQFPLLFCPALCQVLLLLLTSCCSKHCQLHAHMCFAKRSLLFCTSVSIPSISRVLL